MDETAYPIIIPEEEKEDTPRPKKAVTPKREKKAEKSPEKIVVAPTPPTPDKREKTPL